MAAQVVSAEKRYRISLLLDVYGELLTEKQRTFLGRYYEQDFSFGELARECRISRQAIFDSVKHGEAALENYERVLGMVQSRDGSLALGENARDSQSHAALLKSVTRLRKLAGRLAGVPSNSNPRGVAGELESIADQIESTSVAAR